MRGSGYFRYYRRNGLESLELLPVWECRNYGNITGYLIMNLICLCSLSICLLNSIIAQERLDRITECVKEMSLVEQVPAMVKVGSKNHVRQNSPSPDDPDGWMESAIHVDSVLGATAAAAGLISESEMNSFASRGSGHMSPDTISECVSPQPFSPQAEPQESRRVSGVDNETLDPCPELENGFRGSMEVRFLHIRLPWTFLQGGFSSRLQHAFK